MKQLLAGVVLATAMVCTGCATVTRGKSQDWTVNTEPVDAIVSLSNGEVCRTPCTLKLRRKYPFAADICKPGYRRVEAQVVASIHGEGVAGLAGNVALGGLVGVGVDVGNGAEKDLAPNPLQVILEAETPGCTHSQTPAVPDGGEAPYRR